MRQSNQSGFCDGDSGSETTVGEQIVLVQKVKNDLEEFYMQIEKHKNDLDSSFYGYRQQGIPSELAEMYEQQYYTSVATTIEDVKNDICNTHYTYLDAVISGLYELMD